ncbi:L-aminopeptidase/D-esterase [Amycolatopsis xylanica]|uniref:L-aminopeptidase/D-esterase n=1 Tax=Amycolatopsis xylanica TaxID=589385 RepID=A0A1H3NDZ8_9PSEU|nr:P1 family peptidase [Amycolatopsis xylanica]SDY87088.1 L-aminopeptidase/D-esterase [Amycolatopsis xylanica]
MTAGRLNSLTDVPGIQVGNVTRIGDGALTGTTVIVPPPGSVAGVDIRGGAPSTRETAALDPRNGAHSPSAFVLTGGSSYGLSAAHGVCDVLGGLVPAAALFDLGRGGDFHARPDAATGVAALRAADGYAVSEGNAGAGTGALTAEMKGGLGSASTVLPDGTVIAALLAMNAVGSTIGPDGLPYALRFGETSRVRDGKIVDWQEFVLSTPDTDTVHTAHELLAKTVRARTTRKPMNTVIGVVATDALLTPVECHQLARRAQDGLALGIQPSHCLGDGDTMFATATGKTTADVGMLLEAASVVVARAIVHAVLAADSVTTGWGHIASYRELYL